MKINFGQSMMTILWGFMLGYSFHHIMHSETYLPTWWWVMMPTTGCVALLWPYVADAFEDGLQAVTSWLDRKWEGK